MKKILLTICLSIFVAMTFDVCVNADPWWYFGIGDGHLNETPGPRPNGQPSVSSASYQNNTSPVVSATYTGIAEHGSAIMGYANNNDDSMTYGVRGMHDGIMGAGVYGDSLGSYGIGVMGMGYGRYAIGTYGYVAENVTDGVGVLGYAESPSGVTYGVSGVTLTETDNGVGVKGVALATEAYKTYGVYGESAAIRGRGVCGKGYVGVKGWTSDPNGYGVYGWSSTNTGYAIYSEGKMKVEGDLEVAGAIPAYENLALRARALTSSIFNENYAASKLNDGIYSRWNEGEWASLGEKSGAIAQLHWKKDNGQWEQTTINYIKIWPRPNRFDQINNAKLRIIKPKNSNLNNLPNVDVKEIELGQFSNGGAPKELYLTRDEGIGVIAIEIQITETSADTQNIGLAEIECFYDKNRW
jgi:hypothetical protein